MRCKNVMLLVLACILPLLAKATGSSADAVYIDGEEWSLLAKPLEADSAISARLYAFCRKTGNGLRLIMADMMPFGKWLATVCI